MVGPQGSKNKMPIMLEIKFYIIRTGTGGSSIYVNIEDDLMENFRAFSSLGNWIMI